LLDPLKIGQLVILPLPDSTFDVSVYDSTKSKYIIPFHLVYFNDQEPFIPSIKFATLDHGRPFETFDLHELVNQCSSEQKYSLEKLPSFNLYATSEKSKEVDNFCQEHNLIKWYYFSHGLIAQHWFNDFKYFPKFENHAFDKVFITFNNLISNNRSYRLNLVANIIEKNIQDRGNISLSLEDSFGTWQDELFKNKSSRLSRDAKIKIYKNLKDLTDPLTIDVDKSHGALSAGGAVEDLKLYQSALWHVVTETIFYDEKLHLTEKIFKPIVARRPFMLAGAPGNLAYLKSYGFKTFGDYIDESYDAETDPDLRIGMIVKELEKLCTKSHEELKVMYRDMEHILEYNFNWFYNGFKQKVVDEMLINYKSIIAVYNSYQQQINKFPVERINFEEVRKRFIS
jgi:hypothetical protein